MYSRFDASIGLTPEPLPTKTKGAPIVSRFDKFIDTTPVAPPQPGLLDRFIGGAKQITENVGGFINNTTAPLQASIKAASSPGVTTPEQIDPALYKNLVDRGAAVFDISGKLDLNASMNQLKSKQSVGLSGLPSGSVVAPGPTTLRAALPNEPVKLSLNPSEQFLSPNAQSNLDIQASSEKAIQDAIIKQQAEKERPIQTHPLATLASVGGSLFLGEALAAAPLKVAAETAVFTAVHSIADKLNIKLANAVPESWGTNAKDSADILQMVGEGFLTHGIFKKAPSVIDAFTKDVIVKYNLPKQYTIPADVVKDIFQTGTKATPEQVRLFGEIVGGDRNMINNAIKNGLDINIPAEKITSIVDKPYWAKIKNALRIKPGEGISKTEQFGRPTQAPAGLIEGPVPQAPSVSPQTSISPPAIVAPKGLALLNAPKPNLSGVTEGAGFTMKPEATKAEIAKAKVNADYNAQLKSFNQNPTPTKLEKLREARAAQKALQPGLSVVQPRPVVPTIDMGSSNYNPSLQTPENASKLNQMYGEQPQGLSMVQPKTISETPLAVPTVGGEGKISKASRDIAEKLANKGFDALPESEQTRFDSKTKETELKALSDQLASSLDDTIKMALGEMPFPKTVDPGMAFNAIEAHALETDNTDLLLQLSSSPVAARGSILGASLGKIGFNKNPNSPVELVKEANKFLSEKTTKKRTEIKRTVEKEMAVDPEKKIARRKSLDDYLNQIKCS